MSEYEASAKIVPLPLGKPKGWNPPPADRVKLLADRYANALDLWTGKPLPKRKAGRPAGRVVTAQELEARKAAVPACSA
jgi:hypothetical protein